jgi:hypothetical protein
MSKGNSDAEASKGTQSKGKEKKSPGKAKSVAAAISHFEKKLTAGQMKPTVGEYIRLLELQKTLGEDELKEIRVTWVEPSETES